MLIYLLREIMVVLIAGVGCVMEAQNLFFQYINKPTIFSNKKILMPAFVPNKISYRDSEIQQLSQVLAPQLRGYNTSNVFIYGTCGTGKTICTRFVLKQLVEAVDGKKITPIYINCKMKKVSDTEYRMLAQMLRELGEVIPDTGLPTDVLYKRFFEKADAAPQNMIIILDEIDALFRKIGDDFIYNLTRINHELKNSHINIIGITNDLSFRESLDQRVKSSLGEEEILFKPYNALQLKQILSERATDGFASNAVSEAVLNKCAAIAAQEHGDARRALDLLRVAGEIAERMGDAVLTEEHVDIAQQKIDSDRITETVQSQPRHSQALLHAIIMLADMRRSKDKWSDKRLLTGDVFGKYEAVCRTCGMKALTHRRVSDLIGELDMLGIISTNIISKGRYGRTREISLLVNEPVLSRVRSMLTAVFV